MATKKSVLKEKTNIQVQRKTTAKKPSVKNYADCNGHNIYEALHEHFGFEQFKERQEEAIQQPVNRQRYFCNYANRRR